MVHLRMTWLKLTTDYTDLKAAIMETQQLRVTSMSTAILTVFIDSAKHLPVSYVCRRIYIIAEDKLNNIFIASPYSQ